VTPTACQITWTWGYGTVPPEFITQVQAAMAAAALEGSVKASTFGENDGCGGYHPKDVDYIFTVQVENLDAGEDLAGKGADILEIALRFVDESPAPNLGKLELIFQEANTRKCVWTYRDGAWNAIVPGYDEFILCPAPVSDAAGRLADALVDLSLDLACETSTITTNVWQSVLVCERPEEDDRFIVTTTFRLNAEGYAGTCFHGYNAFENSITGDDPMIVTDGDTTYFERDRTFQWTANYILFDLFEQIKGGPEVAFPEGIHELVYQRALQAGLIPGEGNDCR